MYIFINLPANCTDYITHPGFIICCVFYFSNFRYFTNEMSKMKTVTNWNPLDEWGYVSLEGLLTCDPKSSIRIWYSLLINAIMMMITGHGMTMAKTNLWKRILTKKCLIIATNTITKYYLTVSSLYETRTQENDYQVSFSY